LTHEAVFIIQIGKEEIEMSGQANSKSHWTFLSNHAHVLLCIAKNLDFRLKDIAQVVGITERDGRCNMYVTHPEKKLRHPVEAHRRVGDLIRLIENE